MTCLYCGGKTGVVDCRSHEIGKYRRRECKVCNHRFNTIEIEVDYYESLMPLIDEKTVRDAVENSIAEITKKLHSAIKKAI